MCVIGYSHDFVSLPKERVVAASIEHSVERAMQSRDVIVEVDGDKFRLHLGPKESV